LFELAALDVGLLEGGHHVGGELFKVFIVILLAFGTLVFDGAHHEGGFGAFVYADAAALAVVDVNLHLVLISIGTGGFEGIEAGGSVFEVFMLDQLGANGGMGTHEGTLVALDAVFRDPVWGKGSHTTLFQLGGAAEHIAVYGHLGYLDPVSLFAHDGLDHVQHEALRVTWHQLLAGSAFIRQGGRNVHLDEGFVDLVHGVQIHFHHFVAFAGIGLLDGFFDEADGFIAVQHSGNQEEGSLHHGIDPSAQAYFLGDLEAVDVIEFDLAVDDGLLHFAGEVIEGLVAVPETVEQEHAVFLDAAQEVKATDESLVVTSHKVFFGNQILAVDGGFAKTQMAAGDATRFFAVVLEIALHIHVGVVADDLDAVFVGTHGSIGAQAPEFEADGAFRDGVKLFVQRQAEMGDIVFDAHGEAMEAFGHEVFIGGKHHGGGELLAGEAIAAAGDESVLAVLESAHYVEVERFAQGTGFLGAVQHGDVFHGGWQDSDKVFGAEGTVNSHLHEAQLHAALLIEIGDGFFNGLAGAAHGHNHVFGLGMTHIVKGFVSAADHGSHFRHGGLDDVCGFGVLTVRGLASLEIDVRGLLTDLYPGTVRAQSAIAKSFHEAGIVEGGHGVVVDHFDLLQFVGGAEAVKEDQEGDGGLHGGQLGHEAQVHHFLHAVAGDEGKTGVAGTHDVRMISKDREGLGGQRTGRHIENGGQHFAGDLVHVGKHEHQALRGCESGGESTRGKRTVHGSRGPGFGLHFDHIDGGAVDVFASIGGPGIGKLSHPGGGSNRIDGSHFGKRVCDMRGRGVSIHGGLFKLSH